MYFNRYLFFLFLALTAGLLSLYVVVTRLNPIITPLLSLLLFFISFFFASSSFFSLVGYYIRILLYRNELFFNHFNVSLRQGILAGFCVCGLFGLQALRTLNIWSSIILVFLTLLLELYFVAKE